MYHEPLYNENRVIPTFPPSDPLRHENVIAAEIAGIRESAEQMNEQMESDLEQIRTRVHTQQQQQDLDALAQRKTNRTVWSIGLLTLLLAVGLFGAAWYAYPILQNHTNVLSQLMPIRESINSLGKRVEASEEQLRGWRSEEAALGKRLANVETRVAANLQSARAESRELAQQVGQRLEAEMNRRLEPVLTRLAGIESSQQSEAARLEQLRTDVASLRSETAQGIAAMKQETSRDLSDVNAQVTSARRGLQDLGTHIAFDRVDFEIAKNRTSEVIPGISVKLMKFDPSYQRVDGYIQIVPDGHTLWVRGQGIGQPVAFFSQKNSRPYELVFSRVNKNSAVGYVLVPASESNHDSKQATATVPGESQFPRIEALNQ